MAHTDITTGRLAADYTMLYRDYVKEFGALDLSMFPSIEVGAGYLFTMEDLFNSRNQFKEIGAETPELFKAIAERRIREIALIYLPKIQEWLDHYAELWSREETHSEATVDDYFLNPTISATTKNTAPQLQSTSKSTYNHHITFGQGVSNTAMLKEIMELENIYYEALKVFDSLFIQLY